MTLSLHRYESVVIANGLANQGLNPDVEVDITKPDTVIRSQIAALKEMTTWLKAAHSGNDISVDNGEEGLLHHLFLYVVIPQLNKSDLVSFYLL